MTYAGELQTRAHSCHFTFNQDVLRDPVQFAAKAEAARQQLAASLDMAEPSSARWFGGRGYLQVSDLYEERP